MILCLLVSLSSAYAAEPECPVSVDGQHDYSSVHGVINGYRFHDFNRWYVMMYRTHTCTVEVDQHIVEYTCNHCGYNYYVLGELEHISTGTHEYDHNFDNYQEI